MKELDNNERCIASTQALQDESDWIIQFTGGDRHFSRVDELRGQNDAGAQNVKGRTDLYFDAQGPWATLDLSFKLGDNDYTAMDRLANTKIVKSNSDGKVDLDPDSSEYHKVNQVFENLRHDFYRAKECP